MYDLTSLGGLWLMDRERLLWAHGMLRERAWPTPVQLQEARQVAAQKAMRKASGNVAVLPIQGMIEQRMSVMGYMFGGASCDAIHAALDQCMQARDIGAVLLDIDSPGGTSYGVEELADHIRACAEIKPVHAVANSMAASAAYWLASAASSISVTPGGDVGSIGVFAVHADLSSALEQEGVKISIIKAGKYKAEGNPYQPLDQEARDFLQETVDDTYTKFVKAVAAFRGASVGAVRDSYGQGRVLSADKALAAGMVDRISTLRDCLERLCGGQAMPLAGRGLASAEVLRLRHEHDKATGLDKD